MRLYHPRITLLVLLSILLLAGCASPQATQALINVSLTADGQTLSLLIPAGSTVQQALDEAGLSLNTLDRTEPTIFTVLGDEANVRLIRVEEDFEVEQVTIPFKRQVLHNESLPVEAELLIQSGKNGLQEITYRRVFEDGVDVSTQPVPVKSIIVEEPLPEILMVGVQTPFASVEIPGKLIYLRDGNAWVMEGNTGNRRAVLTLGDLDGRVFSLSPDGTWLLFTRRASEEGQINRLWAANISTEEPISAADEGENLADMHVDNVIHFADWVPGSNTKIVFSTVEPREAAPGWQANNDLHALTFSTSGWTTRWTTIIEPNSGGIYGWWGTNYIWEPDGLRLAYARPDSVGIVNYQDGAMTPILELTPLRTRGDWAWVPGITWGPDGRALYTTDHIYPPGTLLPEESPNFDLAAVPLEAGPSLRLVSQTGMFSYPLASPQLPRAAGEFDYQIAYLQAIFPDQSETSRYRLAVIDRDGSNRKVLFPPEGAPGLDPQIHWGAWSPAPMPEGGNYAIAVLYQGNLHLVNLNSGQAFQVTGDGLTSRVVWK